MHHMAAVPRGRRSFQVARAERCGGHPGLLASTTKYVTRQWWSPANPALVPGERATAMAIFYMMIAIGYVGLALHAAGII
jgi:hypothetical protein